MCCWLHFERMELYQQLQCCFWIFTFKWFFNIDFLTLLVNWWINQNFVECWLKQNKFQQFVCQSLHFVRIYWCQFNLRGNDKFRLIDSKLSSDLDFDQLSECLNSNHCIDCSCISNRNIQEKYWYCLNSQFHLSKVYWNW